MTQQRTFEDGRAQEKLLVPTGTCGEACGKVILIGEHAAVDGHPAIALPLKDYNLRVCFGGRRSDAEPLSSMSQRGSALEQWAAGWSLQFNGKSVPLPSEERERLTQSLEIALELFSRSKSSLVECAPQSLHIESRIPLGAGMGGSAALSAALIRALGQGIGVQQTNAQVAELANQLDGFFHGRASGLDAATVVSDSIIAFSKGVGSRPLLNTRGFWLLLVDSGERTPTQDMVRRVAALRHTHRELVDESFSELARLCYETEDALASGSLERLGAALNQAHSWLQRIEVSSPGLERCVAYLRQSGAIGAKLTGGGGGGLALGIFDHQPSIPSVGEWSEVQHYLTFVPASKTN